MFEVYMFPAKEYEYSFQRDSLKETEEMFEGKILDLTEVRLESTTHLILKSGMAIKRLKLRMVGFSRF